MQWQFLMLSIFVLLVGCSSYTETKSPCDYSGFLCGTKQAINQ